MKTTDAISLISKIREKTNRFIVEEMAENGVTGIATSHGDILFSLYKNTTMTMAEIAKSIGKDKSTVTVLINKLVKLGYVRKERSEVDTRVINVTLTKEGYDLKPIFERISERLMDRFYQNITQTEKEDLLALLIRIHNNF